MPVASFGKPAREALRIGQRPSNVRRARAEGRPAADANKSVAAPVGLRWTVRRHDGFGSDSAGSPTSALSQLFPQ